MRGGRIKLINTAGKGDSCTFMPLDLFMIKLKEEKANRATVKEMSRDIKAKRWHISATHFSILLQLTHTHTHAAHSYFNNLNLQIIFLLLTLGNCRKNQENRWSEEKCKCFNALTF